MCQIYVFIVSNFANYFHINNIYLSAQLKQLELVPATMQLILRDSQFCSTTLPILPILQIFEFFILECLNIHKFL